MKKVVITTVFIAAMGIVRAQTSATQTNWENNNNNAPMGIQQDNVFANTEINDDNGKITFSDLPDLKKGTWAIVTDAAGNVMTQKRVSPVENFMDLHRLQKGEMYFVTLVYKNKSKKAFVLHM